MLNDLTEDELAALDDIPPDAVDHWLKGELWDSKTKTWKQREAAEVQPTTGPISITSCNGNAD
jgi:hypothetical protein